MRSTAYCTTEDCNNLGNQSEDMATEGRCGPLCQHPGCWYSGEKHKIAYHKSQGYLSYLHGLASKRSSVSEQQPDSTTEDGLPTLKVQTLDERSIARGGDRALGSCGRARTLPSLRTRTRTPGSDLPPQSPPTSRRLTFAQVVLEREESGTTAPDEITFSPVLIWKPGRRISRPLGPAEGGGAGIGKADASRSQVPLRTMNLTDVLPPERSESARSGESKAGGRKAMPRSTRGHRQPPTADVESFSYLGDIPPHLVAHILEQLRSESSSHVDVEHSRPASVQHRQLQAEVEAAAKANTRNDNNNNNGCHIPSSLVHDLSTGKQYRTSEHLYMAPPPSGKHTYAGAGGDGTRWRTFGSFSRELSRRPLEVLRRRCVRPSLEGVAESTGGPTQEESLRNRNETDSMRLTNAARVGLAAAQTYSPPLPLQKPSKHHPSPRASMDTAVPPPPAHGATGIHPSLAGTRYPHGNPVVPRMPQKSSFFAEEEASSVLAGPDHESAMRTTLLAHPDPSSISPRTVTFQAGVVGNLTEAEQLLSRAAAGMRSLQSLKRSSHVVYVPRHSLPASADSHTLRPLSEEDSIVISPSEMKHVSKSSATSVPRPAEDLRSRESSSHQLLQPRPDSLSPDYMLVGAHISGDQLVLRDGGSQIVHQLTDTESDANILAHSESHSRVAHSSSIPISGSLETPGIGTRAPPSTASHGVKPRGTATQRCEQQSTEHQPESVGTGRATQAAEHQPESVGTGRATENAAVCGGLEPLVVKDSEVTASEEIPVSADHTHPEVSHDGAPRTSLSGCENHSSDGTDSQANADATEDESGKQANRSN